MGNEDDPESRETSHVAGAFLGPGGTFPAALHTLSDEVREEPRVEAEPTPRKPTPVAIGWAIGLAVAFWALGSIVLAVASVPRWRSPGPPTSVTRWPRPSATRTCCC